MQKKKEMETLISCADFNFDPINSLWLECAHREQRLSDSSETFLQCSLFWSVYNCSCEATVMKTVQSHPAVDHCEFLVI